MATTTTRTITGRTAVTLAETFGVQLRKYADPTEDPTVTRWIGTIARDGAGVPDYDAQTWRTVLSTLGLSDDDDSATITAAARDYTAREVTPDEARRICAEDPSLVYVDSDEVAEAIDDAAIRALRREALEGRRDEVQAVLCERALSPEEEWYVGRDWSISDADAERIQRMTQAQARVECARVIADRRAQQ